MAKFNNIFLLLLLLVPKVFCDNQEIVELRSEVKALRLLFEGIQVKSVPRGGLDGKLGGN